MSILSGRSTVVLVGRVRSLNLDPLRSLVTGGNVLLEIALCVITGRFTNELVIRGWVRVILNVGSRNRALENVGWRKRVEYVRCGAVWRRAPAVRFARSVRVACGIFLCGWLYGVCALAVNASAKLPIPIKTVRFITLSV
jgi:hypothetical protein